MSSDWQDDYPAGPRTADEYGGVPLGPDGRAGTSGGRDAVVVDLYLDYMCPVCGQFEQVNAAALDAMRRRSEITLVLHPVAILDRLSAGTEYSTRSASTLAWVADRSPAHVAALDTALFAYQPGEGTPGLTDAELAELAQRAGVAPDIAEAIADGTAVRTFGDWVAATTESVSEDPQVAGFEGFGTPTVRIAGERWQGDWSAPGALAEAIAAARS